MQFRPSHVKGGISNKVPFVSNSSRYTTLLKGHLNAGDVAASKAVLETMSQADSVKYFDVFCGMRQSHSVSAFKGNLMLAAAVATTITPDSKTYCILLQCVRELEIDTWSHDA